MIRRAANRQRWVTVDNRAVEDKRLTLRAKGLLLYILSRPDDWVVHPKQLIATTTDSIGIIRGCLKELKRHGYATLERIALGRGRFGGTEWVIHELPSEAALTRVSTFPNLGEVPLLQRNDNIPKTNNNREKGRKRPPLSKEAAHLYGQGIGLSEYEVDKFYDHHEAAGWMMSKGRRIVDGEAALRTWKRNAELYAQERARGGMPPLQLKGVDYTKLMEMAHARREKLNLLNRNYGDNAPGAVGKQRKQLTAELAQLSAAMKVIREQWKTNK